MKKGYNIQKAGTAFFSAEDMKDEGPVDPFSASLFIIR